MLTCVDESPSVSHRRSETAIAGCYLRQTEQKMVNASTEANVRRLSSVSHHGVDVSDVW